MPAASKASLILVSMSGSRSKASASFRSASSRSGAAVDSAFESGSIQPVFLGPLAGKQELAEIALDEFAIEPGFLRGAFAEPATVQVLAKIDLVKMKKAARLHEPQGHLHDFESVILIQAAHLVNSLAEGEGVSFAFANEFGDGPRSPKASSF